MIRKTVPKELVENLTDNIADNEIGDNAVEDKILDMETRGKVNVPFFGTIPVALESVVLFLMMGLTMSYGIAFQTRPELYNNGTSTLSFVKRYLTLNNSLYITRGDVAAENNGDTFNVATLLQTSIWLAFSAYAFAFIWSFVVFWVRNDKAKKNKTLWGINHFSLYLVSIVSDIIRWSILIKIMGYNEYLSYGFCYFMIFAVATTSFLVALLHQYLVTRTAKFPVNPVFVGFGVIMVSILLGLSLAFTSQSYNANQARQTSLTTQKHDKTRDMFISLMIWLVFRIGAILVKMVFSILDICYSVTKSMNAVAAQVEGAAAQCVGLFKVKVFVEIFEHLIWFATMVVYDVTFFVYFSQVAW